MNSDFRVAGKYSKLPYTNPSIDGLDPCPGIDRARFQFAITPQTGRQTSCGRETGLAVQHTAWLPTWLRATETGGDYTERPAKRERLFFRATLAPWSAR